MIYTARSNELPKMQVKHNIKKKSIYVVDNMQKSYGFRFSSVHHIGTSVGSLRLGDDLVLNELIWPLGLPPSLFKLQKKAFFEEN